MNKTLLIASFIFPERLDWFINHLETKFNIPNDMVFGYENLTDQSKIIVTFKLKVPQNKRLDLKNLFPNAILMHKRGEAFYTINALNKLIEKMSLDSIGNIDYKEVKIDWSEYQNKLILINNKELVFWDIKRLF